MSKEEKKKELAPVAPKEVAVVSEELQDAFGDMGSENVVIPRLIVVQKMSPEVEDGSAKPGELFLKGLGMNMGAGPVEIIPIRRDTSRIKWKAMGDGITCRSKDGRVGVVDPGGQCGICPCPQWSGETPPTCDQYENVLVILRNDQDTMPFLLSGNRTNLKSMKILNTLLLQERLKGRPIYTKSYLVGVVRKAKGDHVWWNYSFRPGNDNKPLPEADQKRAHDIYMRFKDVKLDAANEPVAEEAIPSEEAPTL